MSTAIKQYPLPYFSDSQCLFSALARQPWAVFLDSGHPYSQQGQYDIFAAEPVTTLVTVGHQTFIEHQGETQISEQDPFALLKHYLGSEVCESEGLPFNGGALGYFAYDLARRLETIPELAEDAEHIPDMAVGIYHWAVVVDHKAGQSWLVGKALAETKIQSLIEQFSHKPDPVPHEAFQILTPPSSNMTRGDYETAFNKIKFYLCEGDCYQVNLAQRFESLCSGSPWLAYQALRQVNAAPFSAYMNFPGGQLLSSSPERFLKVAQGEVETKPIKGTRPRLPDSTEDQLQVDYLRHSLKDRAENLMIVDLLRNDISKNCGMGSVRVPKLFDIESFATVHHLVSTVSGTLRPGDHAVDLLRSCFPGGSITGAPKIRAMEIIEELEPNRRGIYCGAIGYIGFNGNMDTNIAIRTLVHSDGRIRFWAGGGIVNDSILEEEYQESFDKAAALLSLLDQFSD